MNEAENKNTIGRGSFNELPAAENVAVEISDDTVDKPVAKEVVTNMGRIVRGLAFEQWGDEA